MNFKYYLLVFITSLLACSPKVTEVQVEEEVVEQTEPEVTEPANPCRTLADLNGALREQTETAYVLYRDQIKLKDYKAAFELWKQAYYNAPAANGSIKYQFEDGIKIYKELFKSEKDSIKRSAIVDSVGAIYDKRVECYGQPAYIAGRKAFDYYYSFSEYVSEDSIYTLFKQAMDGKQEKTDYFVINPFTKILSDKIAQNKIDMEEGRKYATLLWDAIEYGNASGKNKEAWEIINEYAPPRLSNLEGTKGLYDCDYYKNKYYQAYLADSLNCETINTAYSRMLWGGCAKDDPIVTELAKVKDDKCYTPPPASNKLRLAYDAYTDGNYNESIQLFNEYVDESDDPEKKFKYNMLIAKIYYGDIKNFPESRRYALKAADIMPESGEPYLLIGKLYASSGPLCGPGRGWDSQIVTWPAIDMFEKATSDPATAEEARKFIRTYWQYMPKKEDIFQRTIKAGSSFRVGCWINRTTTVRTAD